MTQLTGADALGPTAANVDVFAFYPRTWTREEVAACGARGCLPIVVWDGSDYTALVSEALGWGVPIGSPLCIDIEEGEVENWTSAEVKIEVQEWYDACHQAGLHPWIYSGETLFAYTVTTICNRWLAQWPAVVPPRPAVPPGFSGWQYRGDPNGTSGPDRDVFMPGAYMKPDSSGTVLLGITQEADMPVLVTLTDPENAPGQNPYWLLDDTATVVPEGSGWIAELQGKLPPSCQWKGPFSLIADRVPGYRVKARISSVPAASAGETEPADNPGPVPLPEPVAAPAEGDGPPTTAPEQSPVPPGEEPSEEPPAPVPVPPEPEVPSPLAGEAGASTSEPASPLTPSQEAAMRSAGLL